MLLPRFKTKIQIPYEIEICKANKINKPIEKKRRGYHKNERSTLLRTEKVQRKER